MNEALRERDFDELDEEREEQTGSIQYLYNEDPDAVQNMGSITLTDSKPKDTQPSTAQSCIGNVSNYRNQINSVAITQRLAITPTLKKKPLNSYQKKIQMNYMAMIEPKTKKHSYDSSPPDRAAERKEVGVQTGPISYGPKVDVKYLLGDVRPWGGRAENLPQKGLGLYYSRNPNHLAKAMNMGKRLELPPVHQQQAIAIMVTNSKS